MFCREGINMYTYIEVYLRFGHHENDVCVYIALARIMMISLRAHLESHCLRSRYLSFYV